MIQDTYQTTRELRSAIKSYAKRHGMNKSAAMRRAIVELLRADGVDIELPEIERGGYRGGPVFGRTVEPENSADPDPAVLAIADEIIAQRRPLLEKLAAS